jgi:hypothetical protein
MVGFPPASPKESRRDDHQDILRQIDGLDLQNHQLLSIADNIMKTSFMRNYDNPPQVIAQL